MDIYKLKEKVASVGSALKSISDELLTKLDSPAVSKEELDKLREKKADLQGRFDDLTSELKKAEEAQRKELQATAPATASVDSKELIKVKAQAIRDLISGKKPDEKMLNVLNSLQAIPAGSGTGGEHLLPTEKSRELIAEPLVTNPLRDSIRITNISGLEIPKIAFTLDDDDDFIGDDDTAKELNATGDKVTFGRFKSKVKVRISDTVVHGSDVDLVGTVESNLRSGLAKKEKQVSFVAHDSAETGCAHMTFYEEDDGSPVIREVTGESLFEAITKAIADLHEDFREGAKVVMKYSDYVTMLSALANNSMNLYQAQPEQIIGKPVIFCDSATTPVVGNFNYLQLNYDGTPVYDTDKDVEAGEYIFVLTAWFDQRRLLNSAFRLAVVEA